MPSADRASSGAALLPVQRGSVSAVCCIHLRADGVNGILEGMICTDRNDDALFFPLPRPLPQHQHVVQGSASSSSSSSSSSASSFSASSSTSSASRCHRPGAGQYNSSARRRALPEWCGKGDGDDEDDDSVRERTTTRTRMGHGRSTSGHPRFSFSVC